MRLGRCAGFAAFEEPAPRARLLEDVCGGTPEGLALVFFEAGAVLRAFGAS
jgi:hypothetical protein